MADYIEVNEYICRAISDGTKLSYSNEIWLCDKDRSGAMLYCGQRSGKAAVMGIWELK